MEFDGDPSSMSRPPGIERKFSSWKVLLGHKMKCHRVNNSDSLEEEKEEEDEELDCRDSQFRSRDGAKRTVDSRSSDNENGFPNRKKRLQGRKSYGVIRILNSSILSRVRDTARTGRGRHVLDEHLGVSLAPPMAVRICPVPIPRATIPLLSFTQIRYRSRIEILISFRRELNARPELSVLGNFNNRSSVKPR